MNKYDLLKLWFGNEDCATWEVDTDNCIEPESGTYSADVTLIIGEAPNEIIFNGNGWQSICGDVTDWGISELYATYKNCGHPITLRLL